MSPKVPIASRGRDIQLTADRVAGLAIRWDNRKPSYDLGLLRRKLLFGHYARVAKFGEVPKSH